MQNVPVNALNCTGTGKLVSFLVTAGLSIVLYEYTCAHGGSDEGKWGSAGIVDCWLIWIMSMQLPGFEVFVIWNFEEGCGAGRGMEWRGVGGIKVGRGFQAERGSGSGGAYERQQASMCLSNGLYQCAFVTDSTPWSTNFRDVVSLSLSSWKCSLPHLDFKGGKSTVAWFISVRSFCQNLPLTSKTGFLCFELVVVPLYFPGITVLY